MRRALLLLLLVGCEMPQAITLPLPDGHSVVVNVWGPDECTPVHEAVHQRQIAEMGTARFLARWAWEQATLDDPRCGSIEKPAYDSQLACFADLYRGTNVEVTPRWRCP